MPPLLAIRGRAPLLRFAAGLSLFVACVANDDGVGAPCESREDCTGDLVCDVHDDQGTCQHDHGHGETHGETDGETGGHGETHGDEGCAAETRDDEFAIGLSKSGSLVTASFVSADPAPPIKGDNTWVLAFSDDGGAPIDDLEIVVTPTMPDHGHGTPVEAIVTPTTNPGEYSISPVNLFMAGYWEVALDVTSGEDQDSITFSFCVE